MFCHGVNKSPRDGTLPSGKLSHNYGKSQFLMGQSTISMAIFNSFLYVYQRVSRLSSFLICAQSWWGEFFLKGLRYLRTRDKLRRVEAPGAFKDLWDFCWAPNKPDKVYNIYNISLYIYIQVLSCIGKHVLKSNATESDWIGLVGLPLHRVAAWSTAAEVGPLRSAGGSS